MGTRDVKHMGMIKYIITVYLLTLHQTRATDRPIIGIVAQESRVKKGITVISTSYVKWIESAGAQVVPVMDNKDDEYYEKMFQYTNGLLLQGGGSHWRNSGYGYVTKYFLNRAIKAFDEGDYYPIWGTCRGIQVLMSLVAGTRVTTRVGLTDKALPLNFSSDYKESRLFGKLPDDVETYLKNKNVTPNYHIKSVTTQTYKKHPKLMEFFRVLSTNIASDGEEFISTVEAYNYPVYAIQWHPDKNNFLWNSMFTGVAHTYEGVRVSQHMANFFINEARKNSHRFPSPEMEAEVVMFNYNPKFSRDRTFVHKYVIKFEDLCLNSIPYGNMYIKENP